jgi:hypothetical protein
MIASTSGKYLYNVARPIPVAWAICDIVTGHARHERRGGVQDMTMCWFEADG